MGQNFLQLTTISGGSDGKESACNVGDWIRKFPQSRVWQPTVVLLPGEFCGQRNLAGLRLGSKELEITERQRFYQKNFFAVI